MIEVTDATFREAVRSAAATVVAFSAEWCAASGAFTPVPARLEEAFGDSALFLAASIDDNPSAAEAAGIRAIPCLVLYRDGRRESVLEGARSNSEASRWLAARLAAPPATSSGWARRGRPIRDGRHFRGERIREAVEAAVGE
jgi:thioredoxin 1